MPVRSRVIALTNGEVVLAGKLDLLIELSDGTYAVVDFKSTALPRDRPVEDGPDFLEDHERQVIWYAHALEHAAAEHALPVREAYLGILRSPNGRAARSPGLVDARRRGLRLHLARGRP